MTSKMLYGAENMKKFSIKQISLIVGILATVSFILRIISLLSFHEYSGYYQKDAIVPIISNTVFAISIIFALVATMVFVKNVQKIPLIIWVNVFNVQEIQNIQKKRNIVNVQIQRNGSMERNASMEQK